MKLGVYNFEIIAVKIIFENNVNIEINKIQCSHHNVHNYPEIVKKKKISTSQLWKRFNIFCNAYGTSRVKYLKNSDVCDDAISIFTY